MTTIAERSTAPADCAPVSGLAGAVPDLPRHCGSWVIIRRDTGAGVLETASRTVCERVNAASYEVLTAADYLGRLKARSRAGNVPAWAGA